MIKQFIKLNATLCKDYMQAFKWCRNDLYDNPPADWESAVLGLFEETYPLYPQEPLLLLIKSGVFKEKDYYGYPYNAMSCADKLALFVLLASKSESKELLECWSKFKVGNTVSKLGATNMIR